MKKIFYIVILLLFTAFCIWIRIKDSYYDLLEIKTSSSVVVDFNHNCSYDDGETVTIEKIQVIADENDNLNDEEQFIFNQLAKNFTSEFFFNKKVRYNNNDLIVSGKSYVDVFNSSGFNYKKSPQNYKNIIHYIRTNKFCIVNLHNLKYHNYGCKFSMKSEHIGIFPEAELPIKSVPCKICRSQISEPITLPDKFIKTEFYSADEDIKIYFTDHTSQLKPSKNCSSAVCRILLNEINSARKSIDMAIYGYKEVPAIEAALKNAINRGVKIRMVYDLDSKGNSKYEDSRRLAQIIKNAVSDFISGDEIKQSKYSNIIMHNKFFIIDGKHVITGSANLSPSDMSGFNTNMIVLINSPAAAKLYTNEFNAMYSGKFHNLKNKHSENSDIKLRSGIISVYFSPQDRITKNYIIPIIQNAKHYIYIPAFLITDEWLSNSLIAAKLRGVDIKIILDAVNTHTKYSRADDLRAAGIPVKIENYAGKLHTKSIIIDDEIVITGSMNFSKSGQNLNDENVIIIRQADITKSYREFFEYLWDRIDNRWLKYVPRSEGLDSIGSCEDGIDNNYDGKIDLLDDGCKY